VAKVVEGAAGDPVALKQRPWCDLLINKAPSYVESLAETELTEIVGVESRRALCGMYRTGPAAAATVELQSPLGPGQ
jgi:hypothetical protein